MIFTIGAFLCCEFSYLAGPDAVTLSKQWQLHYFLTRGRTWSFPFRSSPEARRWRVAPEPLSRYQICLFIDCGWQTRVRGDSRWLIGAIACITREIYFCCLSTRPGLFRRARWRRPLLNCTFKGRSVGMFSGCTWAVPVERNNGFLKLNHEDCCHLMLHIHLHLFCK